MEMSYIAKTLEEALRIRKESGAHPLAGGSDLMVQFKRGVGITPEFPFPVVIISGIEELKGISVEDGCVVIKALTTPSEIAKDERVPYLVRKAASMMGAVSLRNTATIGGNLGNASPKGDLPQPLILLDAEVVLASVEGERSMKVNDFILGAKKTALREDEIIKEIRIPEVKYTYLYYRKIGTRRANAISKLSLSALIYAEDGVVKDFRASSGAAGPKVMRSREAEELIIGHKLTELPELAGELTEAWDKVISPHAMPQYRRGTTRRMLEDFLLKASAMPDGGVLSEYKEIDL